MDARQAALLADYRLCTLLAFTHVRYITGKLDAPQALAEWRETLRAARGPAMATEAVDGLADAFVRQRQVLVDASDTIAAWEQREISALEALHALGELCEDPRRAFAHEVLLQLMPESVDDTAADGWWRSRFPAGAD